MGIVLGLFGAVVFVAGATAVFVAASRWRRERRAARTHVSAAGRVVDRYLPRGTDRGDAGPSYTIDFKTAAGRTVRFTTQSVGWKPVDVGGSVAVAYDPAVPQEAFVRGGERVTVYLFGAFGMLFTFVGLLMMLSGIEQAFM